jgi:hypothetical protein
VTIATAVLADLGWDTAGIVHLDELLAAGMTERQIRWMVTSNRWTRIYPRVYATFTGPLSYPARLWAAWKYAGAGAALSHATAAHHDDFGKRPDRVHVSVPFERKVRPQPGLIVHRSRTLSPRDIRGIAPPYTTPERTVIDLLPEMATVDAAIGLVADAVRSRRTTADRIRTCLEQPATGSVRWRRIVLDVLPDINRGAHSPLEVRDAALRRAHNLPMGRRQLTRKVDGTEHLDVIIEEYAIHVELDGTLGHDRAVEIWRDMHRDNRSEVARLRHLRYGWADVAGHPCEVAIQQAVICRQQGWTEEFRRCRRCPAQLPPGL